MIDMAISKEEKRRKKELDAAPCAITVAEAAVEKAQQRIDELKLELVEANRAVSAVDNYEIGSRFTMQRAENARDGIKERITKVRGEYATTVQELQRIEKSAMATRGWYWSRRNGVQYLESRARKAQLEGLIADLVPLVEAHPDLRIAIEDYRAQVAGIIASNDSVLEDYAESYMRLTGEKIEGTDPVPEEDDELTIDWSNIHGRSRRRRLPEVEVATDDTPETPEAPRQQGRPRVGSAAHLGW
jgi:multidrug efflux pump subunit AcrA (membrane-fusion protein)